MKVALVTKSHLSDWVSCQSISSNLLKCYLENELTPSAESTFQRFFFDHKSHFTTKSTAAKIKEWNADKIVFLDHAPCPALLINALFELDASYRPELLIHVFGDFTLHAQAWVDAETALKNYPLTFICASEKQATLVSSFMSPAPKAPSALTTVLPFPVSEINFFHSADLRHILRSKMGLSPTDTVLFYSGRISLQKNIITLIRAFDYYQKHINPNAYLWLAGPVDDLGNPYLGKRSAIGLMSYDIQTLIKDLFQNERTKRIHYFGDLDHCDLNETYNAADLYISLSTHNDEDFGMAPAEALMTGCSCLLTDWGGYSGFKTLAPDLCSLIPVEFGRRKVAPEQANVLRTLFTAPPINDEKRRSELASSVIEVLGLKSTKYKVLSLLTQQQNKFFSEFQPSFKKLAQNFALNPEAPLSCGQEYSSLYKEIYHVYGN